MGDNNNSIDALLAGLQTANAELNLFEEKSQEESKKDEPSIEDVLNFLSPDDLSPQTDFGLDFLTKDQPEPDTKRKIVISDDLGIDELSYFSDMEYNENELFETLEIRDVDKVREEPEYTLTGQLVHIPVQTDINEYILLKGFYSPPFVDFMQSTTVIKDGPLPIAVDINGEIVGLRKIAPEPKILYHIKNTLKSFEIFHVTPEGQQELDIYAFLGRYNFEIGGEKIGN